MTAVVVGTPAGCGDGISREQLAGLVSIDSLAEIHSTAAAADAGLLWLLDSAARPGPDTLPALLGAEYEPAASLPVDARLAPMEEAIGRFVEHDVGALLTAAEAHRVPLRHTNVVSLLISRDAVLGEAPPAPRRFGPYAGLEWTGRLFARRPGMLVPASRVHVGAHRPGSPLHVLRAARSGHWGTGEMLRELRRSVAR